MNRQQRRAQKHSPLSSGEAFAMAVQLHKAGRLAEAVKAYGRVEPGNAQALNYMGAALFDLGKDKDAVQAYEKAIAVNPEYADAHYNLGLALKRLGRIDHAIESYRISIRLNPDLHKAYSNLANILRDLGQLEDAVGLCRQAISLKPDYAEAYANLGNALLDLGQVKEALDAYTKATSLNSDLVAAHWGEAFTRLLLGDFTTGWRKHESRWLQPGTKPHGFPQPQWDGSSLTGKTILLHTEQGLGDSLQFVRYAPLVKARGAKAVILFCTKSMVRLFQSVAGVDLVTADPKKLPAIDVQIPLLSLPLAFGTQGTTIPAEVPYIRADGVDAWKDRLGAGFKVGIAWQGNPSAAAEKGRSFAVKQFEPLLAIPGLRLISLQKNFGQEQLADLPQVETLGKDFDTGPDAFADTAAVMMNLDLIISPDTAIAHLAGALGRPVWVVLQANHDWRWVLGRDDSPWYPTMRLFRQQVQGDWSVPFAKIQSELIKLA